MKMKVEVLRLAQIKEWFQCSSKSPGIMETRFTKTQICYQFQRLSETKLADIYQTLKIRLIQMSTVFLYFVNHSTDKTLGFIHPLTREKMRFNSDLPLDMISCIEKKLENIKI